jgi:predicted ATPase
MLEEFTVDNFKSLINVTFRPREQNLLLGVNNSGKTNLCQAMRFLSTTAYASLDQSAEWTAGGRSTITNRYFAKQTVDFRVRASVPFQQHNASNEEILSFDYQLTVSVAKPAQADTHLDVEKETLSVTGTGFDGVTLLENTDEAVRLLHEVEYFSNHERYVETTAPRDTTMLNRLYDLKTNPRANRFKEFLAAWKYYSLSSAVLHGSTHQPNQRLLHVDGSNLGSVIYQLKTADERLYRKLLEYLKRIDPTIDLINFHVPSEDRVFMFFEDSNGKLFPAASASSGTLRFLALLYVLVAQPSVVPSPFVIIEEPENGIYVGFLKQLLEMVEEVPPRQQVIFTSHSPYFIDLFDNRLDSIFVMKRGEHHSSITQPDVEKVKGRLEKFPLGEMHFREMLV